MMCWQSQCGEKSSFTQLMAHAYRTVSLEMRSVSLFGWIRTHLQKPAKFCMLTSNCSYFFVFQRCELRFLDFFVRFSFVHFRGLLWTDEPPAEAEETKRRWTGTKLHFNTNLRNIEVVALQHEFTKYRCGCTSTRIYEISMWALQHEHFNNNLRNTILFSDLVNISETH